MRRSRIYRLPTSDLELRSKWLSLLNQSEKPLRRTRNNSEEQAHLPIPQEEDLLGFVTSGNFNLAAGKGTGIGAILVNRIISHRTLDESSVPSTDKDHQEGRLMNICIIRAAGESVGRLGRWEVA